MTVVHGYFMSRVLATTELELRDQLLRAGDLDQLIAVHQAYINRIYDRQVFVTNLRGSCATESMTGRFLGNNLRGIKRKSIS